MAPGTFDDASNLNDSFNSQAQTYEVCVGIATRAVARRVASMLKSLPKDAVVCDNACGTGAITQYILEHNPNLFVYATDNAAGMIKIVDEMIARNKWQGKVKSEVQNSSALDFPDDTFDAHVMNFGILFTPDETETVARIFATTKEGGTAIVTCWKDTPVLSMILDVQALVDPDEPLGELSIFQRWAKRGTLESVMRSGGFEDVEMQECSVVMARATMNELVQSLVTIMKSFIGNRWTDEEKSRLSEATRTVLGKNPSKYLSVNTNRGKGVDWVAWVAIAHK